MDDLTRAAIGDLCTRVESLEANVVEIVRIIDRLAALTESVNSNTGTIIDALRMRAS